MPGTAQEILAILVSDHHISQAEADNVTTESLSSGEPIEEILKKKRLVADVDLVKARAKSLKNFSPGKRFSAQIWHENSRSPSSVDNPVNKFLCACRTA